MRRWTMMWLLALLGCTVPFACAGAPPQGAPALAPIVNGLGDYSYPISNCSERAQQFFDQGLRLLHGYHYPESLASFQEASRLAPDCAMTLWGQAMAIAPGANSRYNGAPDDPKGAGADAIDRAMERIENAAEKERALIRALYAFYDRKAEPDSPKRDRAYASDLRGLHGKYPADPEIATMFAGALMTLRPWSYWTPDGHPRPGTTEALAALNRALEIQPDHPGANHTFIHLVEASQEPQRALLHAERLAKTMPNCGHVMHMPSHIYVRIGRYHEAVLSNQLSIAADQRFLEAWKGHEFPKGVTTSGLSATTHHFHAEEFLHLAAMLGGDYETAIESARKLARGVEPLIAVKTRYQRRSVRPYLTYLRFAKFDEMLAESRPTRDHAFVLGIWHFARGGSFVGNGMLDDAQRELDGVRAAAGADGMDRILTKNNTPRSLLTIADHVLDSDIAAARGDIDRAITLLDKAVRLEDGLNYTEPPDWYQTRLKLGEALLKAGRAAEAEVVFWEDLRRNPENGWALHGAWQSLLRQGKHERAAEVEARFRRAWTGADITHEGP